MAELVLDKNTVEGTIEFTCSHLGIRPNPEQWPILLSSARFNQVSGGEQSGKSYCTSIYGWAHYYLDRLKWGKTEPLLYWLVADKYDDTSQEFEYLCTFAAKDGFLQNNSARVDPGQIILIDGTVFKTKSAQDYRDLHKEAPNGIMVCEGGLVNWEAYKRVSGRAAPKRAWVFMNGCLTADTLVFTNKGLKYLGKLAGRWNHRLHELEIIGLAGQEKASTSYYNGFKPTIKVKLSRGFEIEGTPDHKVIVALPNGDITARSLQELDDKMWVAIRAGMNIWGDKNWEKEYCYLAGLHIAEGYWTERSGERNRFTFTNIDNEVIELLKARGYKPQGKYHWRKTDTELADVFNQMGLKPSWRSRTKEVPQGILEAKRECVVAFLQGLFDGDGSATKGKSSRICYYTTSQKLAKQVHMLLLNLGIISYLSTRNTGVCSYTGKSYEDSYTIVVSTPEKYTQVVGFGIKRKQEMAQKIKNRTFYRGQKTRGIELLGFPVIWSRVIKKQESQAETFDLGVPGSHYYCANGLIVHNTMEHSIGWWVEKIKQWSVSNTEGGKSFILPSWTNRILYPGGREDPEILRLERENPKEWFMERMGGEPCPPSGLVFKDFRMELHVGEYAFDPNLPVYPLIDPGYAGAYAIETVQKKNNRLYVVDEVFKQGLVTEEVIDICRGRPWWPAVSYGIVDKAAKQHQAQESVKETWQRVAGKYLASQKVGINEGNERMSAFLKPDPIDGQPKILIDYHCQGLISELGGCLNPETKQIAPYCWKTDRTGVTIGTTPEDKNNHAIKAVIYGLVDLFGYSLPAKQERSQRTNAYRW